MRISASEEYGLRCLLQLARLRGEEHLPASQIAECEGISVQYASKMLHLLRRSGLVVAERGLHGGFRLARAPQEISLVQVFQALNPEREAKSFCSKFAGDRQECVHYSDCSVRPLWQVLLSHFDTMLEALTLNDLIAGETSTRVLVERKSKQIQAEALAGKR